MLSFLEHKAHNMLRMFDPYFKGLRMVVQYVEKEQTHMIIGEYNMYVLFPCLFSQVSRLTT
jgi:hypothetical protein